MVQREACGEAFVMDQRSSSSFLCYTFVFNWVFDQVFARPASPWLHLRKAQIAAAKERCGTAA